MWAGSRCVGSTWLRMCPKSGTPALRAQALGRRDGRRCAAARRWNASCAWGRTSQTLKVKAINRTSWQHRKMTAQTAASQKKPLIMPHGAAKTPTTTKPSQKPIRTGHSAAKRSGGVSILRMLQSVPQLQGCTPLQRRRGTGVNFDLRVQISTAHSASRPARRHCGNQLPHR